ncbi:MAG: alpha/beta hydrolase family protein [Nocardioidaceae bacterium]
MSTVRVIETPLGAGRLVRSPAARPVATLLLGHGAGGGIEARDLMALDAALPRAGVSVVRFEQPWRVAGRRVAPGPAALDAGLLAAANQMRVRSPLVLGGRSAGARSAARMAAELGAVGVLALAFPLHPPGRPDRSRLDELASVRVPTLVVQGERDPFGTPGEFPASYDMATVPGADHGFAVPKRGVIGQDEALGLIVEAVLEWIVRDVVGNRTGR